MEKKQWTMQEDFIFPVEAGVPAGAELLQVTPIYTEERTEDAVRLTGIYHIAANVVFDEGQRADEFLDSAILIDDVELQGMAGYFEYAVPLHIDLPSEVASPLEVVTAATAVESDGQGSFSVVWDVECSYENAVAQEELVALVEEPAIVVLVEEVEEPATIVLAEELEEVAEATEVATATASADAYEIYEAEEVIAVAVPDTNVVATYTSTPNEDMDEALAFIAGLEDGISTTSFRSNDVFIKHES
ncbi:hypothetical protein [Sporosarcina sp. NPDC096371]|uniref:hypothetical protein n=1 Tax=Sporosarcina sp. NPDC096371 TaxID=3364530 RepID=UPI00381B50D2